MIKVARFNERIPASREINGQRERREGRGFLNTRRAAANQVAHKSRACFAKRCELYERKKGEGRAKGERRKEKEAAEHNIPQNGEVTSRRGASLDLM